MAKAERPVGGKRRDRRLERRWRRIIGEQKRSGLTIRQFCRRGKLRETAFYFWRRELQRRQVEDSTRRAEQEQRQNNAATAAPAFVPVRVEGHVGSTAAGRIEIELSGGRRVHSLVQAAGRSR